MIDETAITGDESVPSTDETDYSQVATTIKTDPAIEPVFIITNRNVITN